MKVKLKIEKEFEVKYLKAQVGARYWEDSDVNGVEDTENGDNIPCKIGDKWIVQIDLETGQIINWPNGTTASIHYKSCDDNIFSLLDEDNNVITQRDGYVIDLMSPKEEGFGDYVIMDINENGIITNWKCTEKMIKQTFELT